MTRWRTKGSTWRTGQAITTLARQLEAIWPDRQPSDGTVGDLSHQARRSDHNPNSARVVTAIDVGIVDRQGKELVQSLVVSRDPRIKYIIHNKSIWRSYDKTGLPAWTRAAYTGSNPHKTHVHLSVSSNPDRYDNAAEWDLSLLTGEPEMAQFTEEEAAALKAMVAEMNAVESNPSFVRVLIEWYRSAHK